MTWHLKVGRKGTEAAEPHVRSPRAGRNEHPGKIVAAAPQQTSAQVAAERAAAEKVLKDAQRAAEAARRTYAQMQVDEEDEDENEEASAFRQLSTVQRQNKADDSSSSKSLRMDVNGESSESELEVEPTPAKPKVSILLANLQPY